MTDIPKKSCFSRLIQSGPVCRAETGFPRYLLTLLIVPLFLMQCSGNDDQREFERQAFQSPSGITETDQAGELTGSRDRDDWRIAPFFQGLVEIEPAFPNPALTTYEININIDITGVESVSRIRAVVLFEGVDSIHLLDSDDRSPIPPGLIILRFRADELLRFPGETGIRRVLILDGNDNIISYGDILVE